MGFYLRKSFRAGPIRFNLSKSGIGISAGVKGLRIGTGPKGAYVHAGRHGIYFRKQAGSGPTEAKPSESPSLPHPAEVSVKAQEDAEPSVKIPSRASVILGAIPGLLLALAAVVIPQDPRLAVATVGLAGAAIGMLITWRRMSRLRKVRSYIDLLRQLQPSEDSELLRSIKAAQQQRWFRRVEVQGPIEAVYKNLVAQGVIDGVGNSEFPRWLNSVADVLGLSELERANLQKEAFKELTWLMLSDHRLTPEEEAVLRQAESLLGISGEDIAEELAAIDEFRRAREVEEGRIPEIHAGINLQRAEVCHHRTRGTLLERKVTRTYTVAGTKHKEEALVPIREGEVYVTSKRLLIVGDGISSIPHGKILDLDVDFDGKLLTIVKDGREKPLHLTVPDPIYTGTLIEHLCQGT